MGAWLATSAVFAEPPPEDAPGPLPEHARLAFSEDWSSGRIDPEKWYVLRKKWGDGNHGVVPENVRIEAC